MSHDPFPAWVEAVSQAMLFAIRAKDPYSYGHCLRVAHYSRMLAKSAQLTENEQKIIGYSSLLHDLGKIGICDAILLKPDSLSEEEMNVIKTHPEQGVEILQPLLNIDFFQRLIPGILHHHERIDGKGYPMGLAGNEIPIEARIILIADTFDAMTSTRPYRNGLPVETAYRELERYSGTQFDADFVKIFIKAHPTWDSGELESLKIAA